MVGNKPEITIKKSLFIISAIPLHNQQGASYARLLAYSKALSTLSITVFHLSTEYPIGLNKHKDEISNNVFICGKKHITKDASTFLKRTRNKIFKGKRFSRFIDNVSKFIDNSDGKKSVFIYPSINNYHNELAIIKMVRGKNMLIFSERNELNIGKMLNYPFPKNPFRKILFGIYYPFKYLDHLMQDRLVAKYDGNIVISTSMEKKVSQINQNLIRIPILADIETYNIPLQKNRNNDVINIGFTGYLTIKKDGITELIKAISILKNDYFISNIKLNLYGSGYRDILIRIKQQIESFNLQGSVILYGNVSSVEIPEILKQQDILILARPVNLQTKYGFSTKIAEYMASGVPLLTTDVGDNKLFIKDCQNGFIAKSYRAKDIAEKLSEIIKSKKYLDIGISRKAEETARKYFNGLSYAGELSNFLFPNN